MRSSTYWRLSKDGDPVGFDLYRRHYSARNKQPKQRQFVGPGESTVLIGHDDTALFVWRRFISDAGEQGVNCAVFRNESPEKSSEMILDAMQFAEARWPGERLYTYVAADKIRSSNPGCCFKAAGWRVCGKSKRRGLLILECLPADRSVAA